MDLILRLYGPLEPWFDQSWRPGDAVETRAARTAREAALAAFATIPNLAVLRSATGGHALAGELVADAARLAATVAAPASAAA